MKSLCTKLNHVAKKMPEELDTLQEAFDWLSVAILALFVVEKSLNVVCFGLRWLKNALHALGAFVVLLSFIIELSFHDSDESFEMMALMIMVRLWKIIRIVHAVVETFVEPLKEENEVLKSKLEALEAHINKEHEVVFVNVEEEGAKKIEVRDYSPSDNEGKESSPQERSPPHYGGQQH